MSKKSKFFEFFRGKSHVEEPNVDNKPNNTTESNKEPSGYDEYLAGCTHGIYSGFVIESRYTRDKFPEDYPSQFQTIIYTCKQVFVISNIHYFISPVAGNPGRFFCYLNYDSNDIRVIVEFIKTLLYANTNYIDFNLFYALGRSKPEEVRDDIDFLLNMPPYSLIFGYNKKIRAFFFRDCEITPDAISSSELTSALREKRLDDALNILAERRDLYARIIHTDFRYSYRALYDFLVDSYLALTEFYHNPEMPGPEYPVNFEDMLASFEDAAHFIDKLLDDLEEYSEKYPVYKTIDLEGDLIREAKEYIKNNVATVTLQSVANQFNVSYAHLSRLFKKNVKMNFSEYVADIKLELAAQMLKETDKNISNIASELGYNSPSYFLTRFKERYGVTPSIYRKQYFINHGNE